MVFCSKMYLLIQNCLKWFYVKLSTTKILLPLHWTHLQRLLFYFMRKKERLFLECDGTENNYQGNALNTYLNNCLLKLNENHNIYRIQFTVKLT